MVADRPGKRFQESPALPRPRLCIGLARALYVGPGLQLAPHENVATTLAVALGAPFALRTRPKGADWGPWHTAPVAVIASATLHHLQAHGPMAFLYLDPLADPREPPGPQCLAAGRGRLCAAGPGIGLRQAFDAFGLQPRPPADGRIAEVLRQVDQTPAAFGRLQDAATLTGLSASRFRARFQAEAGLPFRRYRLWRRMAQVMRTVAQGGSLTDAALAAGFASSSHLSSTFKRMFGVSAKQVLALGLVMDFSDDIANA